MNEAQMMVGKSYEVTQDLKIGSCKMKVGDSLKILDWGCGNVSYTVSFSNTRLPFYKFQAGDWVIRQHARELLE